MGVKGSTFYDWRWIDFVVAVVIPPLLVMAVVKFVWLKMKGEL